MRNYRRWFCIFMASLICMGAMLSCASFLGATAEEMPPVVVQASEGGTKSNAPSEVAPPDESSTENPAPAASATPVADGASSDDDATPTPEIPADDATPTPEVPADNATPTPEVPAEVTATPMAEATVTPTPEAAATPRPNLPRLPRRRPCALNRLKSSLAIGKRFLAR